MPHSVELPTRVQEGPSSNPDEAVAGSDGICKYRSKAD